MAKLDIQTLAMIITNKCNLNCDHCNRGCKNDLTMSKDIIEATLKDVSIINNLSICGGEPTLAVEAIESIFDYIKRNNIKINNVSTTINGTIYSEEFLSLLEDITDYMRYTSFASKAMFNISRDYYHTEQLKEKDLVKTYIENFNKYQVSPHFGILQETEFGKIYQEGNAENIDNDLVIPLIPLKRYVSVNETRDTLSVGPVLAVNPSGIVTEADASIKNQEEIYNYGNVLEDSLENIVMNQCRVINSKEFLRVTKKELDTYRAHHL